MEKTIINNKWIRPFEDEWDGIGQKLRKRLQNCQKSVTVADIQNKLGVSCERAKHLWYNLRAHIEHAVGGGSTHMELYFSPEKLRWWTKNRCAVIELCDKFESSVTTYAKICGNGYFKGKKYCKLITFDTTKPQIEPIKNFLLVKNFDQDKIEFSVQMLTYALSCGAHSVYLCDDYDGAIYKWWPGNQGLWGNLNVDNFNKLLGLDDNIGCLTHFPRGIGRMAYSHLLEADFETDVETAKNEINEFLMCGGLAKDYEIIKSREELARFFNERTNSYEFLKDTLLAFDIEDNLVNIRASKKLCSLKLAVRNIEADGGIIAESLHCNSCKAPFIATSESISCPHLSCPIVHTTFDKLKGKLQQTH